MNNEINKRISELVLPQSALNLMDSKLYIDWDGVKTNGKYNVMRKMPGAFSEDEARRLWKSRFGYEMPEDAHYGQHAETTPAYIEVYDGDMVFTEKEANHIREITSASDFTMDMAYLLFDHLKWRPLQRVPLSDPAWEYLINHEPANGWGYVHILCDVIGYDDDEFLEHLDAKIDDYHDYYDKHIRKLNKT